MKPISLLSLLIILIFGLAGCTPVSPLQATQKVQIPSSTNFPATETVAPTSAEISSRITTHTPIATLAPESVKETMQPLLQDPMNCAHPCFLGITPGKTSVDEAKHLVDPLGFKHREGKDPNSGRDFYSFAYESSIGHDSGVILYTSDNVVENIEITPKITIQTDGSSRQWIAYSPETLIKKYGKPSRVEFGVNLGQVNMTINMILYFDQIDVIALYSGLDNTFKFCPFTFPFDDVRVWMGTHPPHPPQFPTIPLEQATSLTMDQFTELMLGDPQDACFTLNEDAFK